MFSCDRAKDDGGSKKAQFQIQMPSSNLGFGKQEYTAQKTWANPDPSNINDFNCFAVFVEGPEPEMSNSVCKNSGGAVVARPGQVFGGFLAGSFVTVENVNPGPMRKISIIGLKTSSESVCINLKGSQSLENNSSAPFILGSIQVPLVAGENRVLINIALNAANKFDDCEGPAFNWQNGGSGGSGEVATKMTLLNSKFESGNFAAFRKAGGPYNCIPLWIQSQTAAGQRADPPPGTNFILTGTSGDDHFYSDGMCSNEITGQSKPLNWSTNMVYYANKSSGDTGSTITLGGTLGTSATGVTLFAHANPDTMRLVFPDGTIRKWDCQSVLLTMRNETAQPGESIMATQMVSPYTNPSVAGLTYYTDGMCTQTTGSSTNIGSTENHKELHFIYTGGAPTVPMTFTGSVGPQSSTYNVTEGTTAGKLSFFMPKIFNADFCQPVAMVITDNNGRPVGNTTGGGLTVNLSATAGQFYSNPICTMGVSSVNIADQSARGIVYYKYTTPMSSAVLTASATLGGVPLNGTMTIGTTDMIPYSLAFVLPGQTFVAGTGVTGNPTFQAPNTPITVEAYILTDNKNVIANSSGTFTMNYGGGGTGPGTLSFAPGDSGHKTFSVQYSSLGNQSFNATTPVLVNSTTIYSATSSQVLIFDPTPTKANIAGYMPTSAYTGTCTPFLITSVNDSDHVVPVGSNKNVNFTVSNLSVFSDSGCSVPLPSPAVIPSGASHVVVFVHAISGATTGDFTIVSGGDLDPGSAPNINNFVSSASVAGTAVYSLTILGPTKYKSGFCAPLLMVSRSSSQYGAMPASNATRVLTYSGSGGETDVFYADANCTTTLSNMIMMTTSDYHKVFYIKAMNPYWGVNIVHTYSTGQTYTSETQLPSNQPMD